MPDQPTKESMKYVIPDQDIQHHLPSRISDYYYQEHWLGTTKTRRTEPTRKKKEKKKEKETLRNYNSYRMFYFVSIILPALLHLYNVVFFLFNT
jgi:hypothetical protein